MKKFAAAMTLLILASCGAKDLGKKDEIKAVLVHFNGSVNINGKAIAAPGETIKYGDLIETGDKSSCDIIINEKNILRLNKNTKLAFKISDKENILELKAGWLAGVTKKIFATDHNYLIRTPTVVASVRGTSFCTKVEAPDRTYFCVCNGKIELKKSDGETGDMISAPHHSARRFKKEKDGSIGIEQNPGVLYHDDKGLESLAKTVDVHIDWTKAE